MVAFLEAAVGEPVEYEALCVFPLFTAPAGGVDYLLSDEAIGGGAVKVEEVGEAGSVPNLLVDNSTDSLVLFLEGEELRGAKQNRVLNTSVLAPAKHRTVIPVSCVEHGRWRYNSPHFGSSGSHSSSQMRHVLRKSVTKTVLEGHGHGSDQGAVWTEVARQSKSLGTHSPTGAMADTYDAFQGRVAEYQDRLKYVEGATGLAVAIGGKIVSVDLFDKPLTCRKVWGRLMTGLIMDALEAGKQGTRATSSDVQEALAALRNAPWLPSQAVGAGEEFRAVLDGTGHVSALTFGGTLVHGSLVRGM
jgi:hypothetical protein